jgi:hypothetical protein
MKAMAEVIIAVADLVEAEVRQLKVQYYQKALLILGMTTVWLLVMSGLGLVSWSIFTKLGGSLGSAGAGFAVGMLFFALGGGFLWLLRKALP